MSLLKTLLCGLVASAFALVSDAHAEKRVALVIGNSAYSNVRSLANPERDANAIAGMLRAAKFDVVEAHNNLSGNAMRRAVRNFSDIARDADIAVVYYAGHGIEVNGANYLLPIDTVLERDLDVEDEGVSLDRIVSSLEPVKRLRLIMLDACRDNPFVPKMKRLSATRSIGRGLARVEPSLANTLIAFAAKAGSTASDGDDRHSPFARALLKHLPTPGLDLRIAFGQIRDEVLQLTGSRQEPFVYGSLGGTTVSLVPAAPAAVAASRPAATPAPAPSSTSETPALALLDYELASKVGTIEAWEAYLKAHPRGFYSDLARSQRDRAIAANSGVTSAPAATPAPPSSTTPTPAPPATPVIAAVQPTPAESRKPAVDPAATARSVQKELARLGCYTGDVNATWGKPARDALTSFNRYSGMRLDVSAVSTDTLDALKDRTGRICPLQCGPGLVANGDRCERKPVEAKKPEPKKPEARKPVERAEPARRDNREAASSEKRKPQAFGGTERVVCGMNGCLPVRSGCRGSTIPSGSGEVAVVSCN